MKIKNYIIKKAMKKRIFKIKKQQLKIKKCLKKKKTY